MARSIIILMLAAFLSSAGAQRQDPLNSPACMAAREQLETALAQQDGNAAARRGRVAETRRLVLDLCLASTASAGARSGAPQAAQIVPPVTPARPAVPLPLPSTAPAPPPLPVPRVATITQCDPGGCWDSEGRRLNHAGPLLMGPHGLCSVQGGAVQCPR